MRSGVGKIKIGISMVATGDEHMRTDQLPAGSHFSWLSGYVTAGKHKLHNQPVISFSLWAYQNVIILGNSHKSCPASEEEEYHI